MYMATLSDLFKEIIMTIRVATDVGGTFTDLVYIEQGTVKAVKSDTTPPNFEQGVINTVDKANISLADVDFFAHGSTVVINAITERKGVKTALITTQGFRDVLEIARGNTPDIFNNCYQKPTPFVERHLRRELPGRLDHLGREITPLDLSLLPEILTYFKSLDIQAIAVCFLHSYLNNEHEKAAVIAIQKYWPEVDVIASYEISSEWREYERTNTTVLSAYVLPPAQQYLNKLNEKLAEKGLKNAPYIMQSNGGIATLKAACKNPITLVESGPVGGILGAVAYGKVIGDENLLALDIGGTTAKCSLINQGETRITTEYMLEKTQSTAGYPIKTPVIDIVEIGNGGGSIAWIDAAGSLHVGPKSAGSTPGPVAYGRNGTEPTTTDANLYTGRINPDNFAGGEIKPAQQAVHNAFKKLGDTLGVTAMEIAHGVLKIANSNMVNALKLISVNRGFDPRDFSLMAFGGGGALHATALAKELNVRKVIIPPFAGVFSAWGMLMLDLRRDYIHTHKISITNDSKTDIGKAFDGVITNALADYKEDGFSEDKVMLELYVDARYHGQEHTVKIPVPGLTLENKDFIDTLSQRFHQAHEQEYTFNLEDSAIEIVNIHLVAFGLLDKAEITPVAKSESADASTAIIGQRDVDFDELGTHNTPLYNRELLTHGMKFSGPAIIEEPTTTTVILPDNKVEIDAFGGIHIHLTY